MELQDFLNKNIACNKEIEYLPQENSHSLYLRAIQQDRQKVLQALADSSQELGEFTSASTWRGMASVLSCFTILGILVWLWQNSIFSSYWIFIFFGIGLLQHGFLNLMHEASHYSLVPSRFANEFIGQYFLSLPLGMTLDSYRHNHKAHHRYLGGEADTSNFVLSSQLSRGQLFFTLACLLAGRPLWDFIFRLFGKRIGGRVQVENSENLMKLERKRLFYLFIFHGILAAISWHYQLLDFWLAWSISLVTVLPFLDNLRTVAEHRRGKGDAEDFHTRSHHLWSPVSWIATPFFQFHWEHHLFPQLPHFQLARLHRFLLNADIKKAQPVKGGFFGAFCKGLGGVHVK